MDYLLRMFWPSCKPVVPQPSDVKSEGTITLTTTYTVTVNYAGGASSDYGYPNKESASTFFYRLNDSIARGDRVFMVESTNASTVIALGNVTHIRITTPVLMREALGI
jgi:hypothetical protein